jgi:hypothetical protein
MVHVGPPRRARPLRIVFQQFDIEFVEPPSRADVKAALTDLLDGGDPRKRQEDAEMIGEIGIGTGDGIATDQILRLQRLAIGCQNEPGLCRCRLGAVAQGSEGISRSSLMIPASPHQSSPTCLTTKMARPSILSGHAPARPTATEVHTHTPPGSARRGFVLSSASKTSSPSARRTEGCTRNASATSRIVNSVAFCPPRSIMLIKARSIPMRSATAAWLRSAAIRRRRTLAPNNLRISIRSLETCRVF